MRVIDRINICLSKAGESGADLSRALNLSSGVYSQWCSGMTKPSKRNIAKIAEHLGVTVEYLLYGDEKTAAQNGDGLDEVMDFLRSLPVDRLRGILLALGAPEEVIAALDRSEPPK